MFLTHRKTRRSVCFCGFIFLLSVEDFAHRAGSGNSGVGFVGVNVHGESEFFAYSYNNIVEYERASACGINLNLDNLLVLETVFFRVGGGGVDVPFRGNNAAFKFDFALGAHKFAGARALDVAAFANGSGNAD